MDQTIIKTRKRKTKVSYRFKSSLLAEFKELCNDKDITVTEGLQRAMELYIKRHKEQKK